MTKKKAVPAVIKTKTKMMSATAVIAVMVLKNVNVTAIIMISATAVKSAMVTAMVSVIVWTAVTVTVTASAIAVMAVTAIKEKHKTLLSQKGEEFMAQALKRNLFLEFSMKHISESEEGNQEPTETPESETVIPEVVPQNEPIFSDTSSENSGSNNAGNSNAGKKGAGGGCCCSEGLAEYLICTLAFRHYQL